MTRNEEWLLHEKYNDVKNTAFLDDCKRLEVGEPLGYIIGFVPFLSCRIHLDSRPLIPRPETEFWVEKAIEKLKSTPTSSAYLLDLCAGSGCVGIALAKHLPEAAVDFAEIDPSHLPTIERNLRENLIIYDKPDMAGSLHTVFESDLFENIPREKKYDYILSNPPYIDPALDRAEPSVKEFEPHGALYGGPGGTAIIERIITEAPCHLESGGELWIEHEPEQSVFVQKRGNDTCFSVTVHKDQYGVERYSVLVLQ